MNLNHLDQIAALDRSLVVVIDVQNDFCSDEGALYGNGGSAEPVQRMLPTLSAFLGEVRGRRGNIVFTRHEDDPTLLSPIARKRNRLLFGSNGFPLAGTWGADLCPPILPLPHEPVIVKNQYSIFTSPAFLEIVRRTKIETLILTGVLTNVCVQAAAWESDVRGYYLVVLEDCVASNDAGLHKATLDNIQRFLGWVCPAGELLASWASSPVR